MLFNYKYGGSSSVMSNNRSTAMSFAPDSLRQPTFFVGKLNKHIPFREAISALHDVVISDLRFKPKDREEYMAWLKTQEELWLGEAMSGAKDVEEKVKLIRSKIDAVRAKKNKIMGPYYKAQKKYFDYIYKRDIDAWYVLDPVITVHPDELFFECFSEDESSYGKLGCNYNVFKEVSDFECGTTNIDYSAALYNEFQKIRNYKETEFKVDPSGFEVQTGNEDKYKEVKIDLPDSWVRGFLQVSSAMTLPAVQFDLHPMDIHNFCFILKRNKARTSPRSMKYILEPGKPIRVLFEPWNKEVICSRSIYKGKEARTIRVWGRRRLLILERLISVSKKFTVTLLGTGLPSFYIADLGDMNFTLGLSGWTSNDWSKSGNFDLLAPRKEVDIQVKKQVFEALKKDWKGSPNDLANQLNLGSDIIESALSAYTQAGRVIYDLDKSMYRVRELSRDPLPMESLMFANPNEKTAWEILKNSEIDVQSEKLESNGLRLSGSVQERGQNYYPEMELDGDGRVKKASCDCYYYRSNQLRKGPCAHMLGLRKAFSQKN